ncbi:MAG: PhzF family phenazine biosynthesis protein [Leptolyngbyaceae bacterium]|nr:PhzF family phenazine biosynthesis protein [Leptolyngbyaceae bacterium]
MNQRISQVDAFTDRPFSGNPAAVCVLSEPQPDDWMQQVAQEMNLSETAFLLRQEDGFNLRWFTPTTEVDLCGHATLASAHVLWSEGHLSPDHTAVFSTRSGILSAQKSGDWIELDFPAAHLKSIPCPEAVVSSLQLSPVAAYDNQVGYLLVEVETAAQVRQLSPDFRVLAQAPFKGVIVTSRADNKADEKAYDFVSRFFGPNCGIDEDPVTGSAHCALAPFWRDRLHKNEMIGYQASARGGVVKVRYDGGDRVFLRGQAVTVMIGELQ